MAATFQMVGAPEVNLGPTGSGKLLCYNNGSQTYNLVTSPAPRHPDYQTWMVEINNATPEPRTYSFTIPGSGTHYMTFGWGFRTNNITNDPTYKILEFNTNGTDWTLRLNGSTLEVRDVASVLLGSAPGTILVDTTYFIEVLFNKSSTGDIIVNVDGKEKINLTGVRLDGGGGGTSFFRFNNTALISTLTNVYTDGFYLTTNPVKTTADFWGDVAFRNYQNSTAAVPKVFGTTPSTGTWDDAGETPGTTTRKLTWAGANANVIEGGTTCGEGARLGPRDDAVVLGADFKGGVVVAYAKDSTTFGFSPYNIQLRVGQQVNGLGTTGNTKLIGSAVATTTSFKAFTAYFNAFKGDDTYDENKWAQHAINWGTRDLEDVPITGTLADLWSLYAYIPKIEPPGIPLFQQNMRGTFQQTRGGFVN